jgi:GNAT superfamily N-acetyltransferase
MHDVTQLPAAIAVDDDRRCGVATYCIERAECEIVTLDAYPQWRGIGTALVDFVAKIAKRRGCLRLVAVTTNDNLDAAVHVGAADLARVKKPAIPRVGMHGIAIRDEIELHRVL